MGHPEKLKSFSDLLTVIHENIPTFPAVRRGNQFRAAKQVHHQHMQQILKCALFKSSAVHRLSVTFRCGLIEHVSNAAQEPPDVIVLVTLSFKALSSDQQVCNA